MSKLLRPLLLALAGSIVCWSASLGERPGQGDGGKPLFQRLIGPNTMGFYHLDLAKLMGSKAWQGAVKAVRDAGEAAIDDELTTKQLGLPLSQLDSLTVYFDMPRFTPNDAPPAMAPPYFLVSTKQPVNEQALVAPLGSVVKKTMFGKFALHSNDKRGLAVIDDRHVLFVLLERRPPNQLFQEMLPHFAHLEAPEDVPQALVKYVAQAADKKHLAVAGFIIPTQLGTLAAEQLKSPQAPAMLKSFLPLTAIKSAGLTIDLTNGENDIKIEQTAEFPDAPAAQAGAGAVRFALTTAKLALGNLDNKEAFWQQARQQFTKWIDAAQVTTDGPRMSVVLSVNAESYTSTLMAAVHKVRSAADRMVSANNMRQIMIAMHNYHEDYNNLPSPAALPKNGGAGGKSLLSWRVTILPYIEADQLYKQFKLDEPWDSEHNKAVFEKNPMPKIYEHPGKKDGASKMTYYKVFVSKPDDQNPAGFTHGKKLSLGQLTVMDGTSNTVGLIEAGPPVSWTKPDDIEFDSTATLPKMISPWKDPRVNVAFFDGSVRQLVLGIHEDLWKAIITRRGGETVDVGKLEEGK